MAFVNVTCIFRVGSRPVISLVLHGESDRFLIGLRPFAGLRMS